MFLTLDGICFDDVGVLVRKIGQTDWEYVLDGWVKISDAAKYLGVSERTVYSWKEKDDIFFDGIFKQYEKTVRVDIRELVARIDKNSYEHMKPRKDIYERYGLVQDPTLGDLLKKKLDEFRYDKAGSMVVSSKGMLIFCLLVIIIGSVYYFKG